MDKQLTATSEESHIPEVS